MRSQVLTPDPLEERQSSLRASLRSFATARPRLAIAPIPTLDAHSNHQEDSS
jgi:hypothetical protein